MLVRYTRTHYTTVLHLVKVNSPGSVSTLNNLLSFALYKDSDLLSYVAIDLVAWTSSYRPCGMND